MKILDAFRSRQPCPYLPDRPFESDNLLIAGMESEEYVKLLGRSFRRSGRILYRPSCTWCRQCVPLRVLVREFRPSRSQRRALRKNADLSVTLTNPVLDDEHVALYNEYLLRKHQASPEQLLDRYEYAAFLVDSPVPSLEFQYRAGGRLAGVGIVDDLGTSTSTVYFYYDLDHGSRSLGVYSLLVEIEHARRLGYRHHYLGYWVRESPSMAYKARYRPAEILDARGRWMRLS